MAEDFRPHLRQVIDALDWVDDVTTQVAGHLRSVWQDGLDVRLQVSESGGWALHTGSAQYDTDHTGYWGSDTLAGDSATGAVSLEMAKGLVDQVLEDYATRAED